MFGRKKKSPSLAGTKTHNTKTALIGSVYAVNMIALADGKIAPEELESLTTICSSYMDKDKSPSDVLEFIQKIHESLQKVEQQHWGFMFEKLKPIHKTDRSFIMHSAGSMAIVDQEMHEDEQFLLVGIAQAIGMPKKEFIKWCGEFQARIDEARANGYKISTPDSGMFT